MHELSLSELATSLQEKKFSSRELTNHFLQRIKNANELNAFISIDEENALKSADFADKVIAEGNATNLTGIPMAHKDIFCTKNSITSCGSKMLANFIAPYNATIVDKLAQHGVISLGKANMDEFAMGATNETSYFGACKNPWNLEHVPGGSSGGSAAAVSANLVPFTTGSDTGGSIRQPAAFCSLSGLKPTYGLVSRFGMIAFASSLDQAGPMAHSAEDLAIILEAMAGFDSNDSTSVNKPVPHYYSELNKSIDLQSIRIGLPNIFFDKNVDPEIQLAIEQAIKVFEAAGAKIVKVNLDLHSLWVPCYCVVAYAEASSNLARYDGIRYGHRSNEAKNLFELITKSRDEAFGLEVKRRILTGTYVLSSGYFDDYYVRAQKVRRMIQQELTTVLDEVDVLLGPTTPILPYKLGQKVFDPVQRSLSDSFTVAANLAGIPGLSIPAGFSKTGLPIGLQLTGSAFSEQKLLSLAHFFQQNTNWHKEKPKME